MKQVDFISRHGRQFSAYEQSDKSSMTEQNLRLSQAEKAIDMANGRIPIIPPAVMAPVPDSSDVLPAELQTMLGVYHSPFVDPATKSAVFRRLRNAYADHISQREAQAKADEDARSAQKEADYQAFLRRFKDDLATSK